MNKKNYKLLVEHVKIIGENLKSDAINGQIDANLAFEHVVYLMGCYTNSTNKGLVDSGRFRKEVGAE